MALLTPATTLRAGPAALILTCMHTVARKQIDGRMDGWMDGRTAAGILKWNGRGRVRESGEGRWGQNGTGTHD